MHTANSIYCNMFVIYTGIFSQRIYTLTQKTKRRRNCSMRMRHSDTWLPWVINACHSNAIFSFKHVATKQNNSNNNNNNNKKRLTLQFAGEPCIVPRIGYISANFWLSMLKFETQVRTPTRVSNFSTLSVGRCEDGIWSQNKLYEFAPF